MFGEDGDVAVEAESQVMTITSATLTTGVETAFVALGTAGGGLGVALLSAVWLLRDGGDR